MEFGEIGAAATRAGVAENLARSGQETPVMLDSGEWSDASSVVFATLGAREPLNDLSLSGVLRFGAGNALNEKQHA
jgi:hypothetical protein